MVVRIPRKTKPKDKGAWINATRWEWGGAGEGAGTSGGPNALDVEVVAERWMKQ